MASGEDPKLIAQPYFHGLLPREDIKQMLRGTGDFLVRTTEPTAGRPRCFVLSLQLNGKLEEAGIKHYVVNRNRQNKFVIDFYGFDSVADLVSHHTGRPDPVSRACPESVLKTPVLRQAWELTHEEIEVTKKLGEGAFGEVSLGRLTRKNSGQVLNVAIKLAKLESLTKEQIKEIMHEARLMRMFDHPNVIRIYGVAALQEPLMLVMELADSGALDSYLRKNEVSVERKIEMCAGGAFGLEYLHTCNVIHRDIAARNLLFGEGKVKISDFGLTREGAIYQMNPSKRVPIRWLAPETLRTAMYSQKSDVFAYGILCWEIFANAVEPYPGWTVAEVNVQVKQGYRMPFPDGTPTEVAALVHSNCWAESPNDRYSMADVARFWERQYNVQRPVHGQKPATSPAATAEYHQVPQNAFAPPPPPPPLPVPPPPPPMPFLAPVPAAPAPAPPPAAANAMSSSGAPSAFSQAISNSGGKKKRHERTVAAESNSKEFYTDTVAPVHVQMAQLPPISRKKKERKHKRSKRSEQESHQSHGHSGHGRRRRTRD